MTLVGLRSAVKTALETSMTEVIDVDEHGGTYSQEEVIRWASRSPAIRVAILGIKSVSNDAGATTGEVMLAAFVVTHGTSQTQRDADALTLVETVIGHAANNLWDYSDAGAPKTISSRNLYTKTLDMKGVALWAVSWSQNLDLSIPSTDDLDNLYTVHVDHDLQPIDGVADLESLIAIRGTYMSYYGQIYLSSSVGTAIAVADTYQKLSGTTTLKAGAYDEFDMPATGRLRHTGSVDRPCKVSATGSFTVSADAKITLALAEDGVVDTTTEQEIDATAAGGVYGFSLEGIESLDTNEYVEVWVKADDTITVTATKLNLVAAAT